MSKDFKTNKIGIIIILFFICMSILLIKIGTKKDYFFEVDGEKYTLEEYNVFYIMYTDAYINLNFDSLKEKGLDINKSYNLQKYSDTQTWEEYFKELVDKEITTNTKLYLDSKKNKIDFDVKEDVEIYKKSIEESAKSNNIELEQYYKNLFGEKITEKQINRVLTIHCVSTKYRDFLYEQFRNVISDKDLMDMYSLAPEKYDTVHCKVYYKDYSDQDFTTYANMKNDLRSIKTEEDFDKLAESNTKNYKKSLK